MNLSQDIILIFRDDDNNNKIIITSPICLKGGNSIVAKHECMFTIISQK